MPTGFLNTGNISFALVLLEGILSFFSPCVIPLLPVYMGYLAGNAKSTDGDGSVRYHRKKVFLHTLFFVFGISTAFFILGMSFTALGTFFKENRLLFTRIGGVLILLLGLVQVGFLELNFLKRERRFHFHFGKREMNPLIAYVMGFTFSFAWTPCVGPALSSVLIMASGSSSSLTGNLLVLVYALGFVLPFLLLGLFTTQVLNFLNKNKKLLKYTVKAGGILLILIGIMTFTGWMNGVSGYLNRITSQGIWGTTSETAPDNASPDTTDPNDTTSDQTGEGNASGEQNTDGTASDNNPDEASSNNNTDNSNTDNASNASEKPDKEKVQAFDFTLTDQYGNTHTLSDYKGKVVFLNFWATWCGPCKVEMPDIEKIYKEYGLNKEDVVILGVANPASKDYPRNADVSKEEIITFLEDNEYTFPVVFDETGTVLSDYYISAFPTTFLIDKEGNIYGYATGTLTKDIMDNVIKEAMSSTD